MTYCTVDVGAVPTAATGNLSMPRKAGPLDTVAYLHGEPSENGESFNGPPSSAIFAGAGFVYVAPDYLGLGGSAVPRHRYFHAATEAGLFDMRHYFDDVVAAPPPTSRELLTASYIRAVTTDPDEEPRARLPGLDHVNSWVRAMPRAAGWFERRSAA